ncbi:uncharacterized protein [Mytilus edulis]|uniref:uncharacterized protein n=1 Tax=Mytilus edulis TaxID=6550 RepID=UPI0039EFA3AA
MSDIKRIGIIEAGLHGISALRRLSQNENFKLTCFERNFDLGGTWLYTDQIKEDIYGRPITSAIYHNLRNCSMPKYPDVENQEEFEGLVLHSMWYRRPENFVDLKVALLGCRYTGIDLAFELSKFAKKVYLCHNWTKAPTILPDSITEKRSSFKQFTKSSVILDNDDELDVDAVIYCTGYQHEFKFLQEGIVKIGKNSDIVFIEVG